MESTVWSPPEKTSTAALDCGGAQREVRKETPQAATRLGVKQRLAVDGERSIEEAYRHSPVQKNQAVPIRELSDLTADLVRT